MAGRRFIYDGSSGDGFNVNSVPITQKPPSFKPLDSFFLSGSSPSFVSGSRSMVSFEDVTGGKRSSGSLYQSYDFDGNEDEDFDEYFQQPEKKRRLKADQVRFLEKSFEEENKLEPERKVQLAKDLGLQPRQVAIWFQNRRARWKNKQLEKEYDILQDSYNSLKANFENLLEEKDKLKAEVVSLSEKLLVKEKENSESFNMKSPSEQEAASQEQSADVLQGGEVSKVSMLEFHEQDDNVGAKSDVLDSDSPHYTDGSQSPLFERGDSSYLFEAEQSDVSQDEEDSLLPPLPYTLSKLEDGNYPVPPVNSCYFGYPGDDQAFGFWSSY